MSVLEKFLNVIKLTDDNDDDYPDEGYLDEPEENAENPGVGFDDEITRIDPEENPEELPENPDAALPEESGYTDLSQHP